LSGPSVASSKYAEQDFTILAPYSVWKIIFVTTIPYFDSSPQSLGTRDLQYLAALVAVLCGVGHSWGIF
jgi:hypothetical protein